MTDESESYPPPSEASAKRRRRWPWIVGGVLVVIVMLAVVGEDETDDETAADGAPTTTEEATNTEKPPTTGDSSTTVPGVLAELEVAPEDDAGYDGDLFGDYDREALLEESLGHYGCYYSVADDTCYEDASQVHVDHLVALAEAWESGIEHEHLDAFGGDPDNLWLMTADLNVEKSDQDIAEWLPPEDDVVCIYFDRWVEVKVSYELSIDRAEFDSLAALSSECGS